MAVAKINSLKDRVEGKKDCTIVFDGEDIEYWPESKLEAVIDHELTHFEVVYHAAGPLISQPKTDDCGRPRLKMRLHDVQIGGFDSIIERHGMGAVEARQIADAAKLLPTVSIAGEGA